MLYSVSLALIIILGLVTIVSSGGCGGKGVTVIEEENTWDELADYIKGQFSEEYE
jgi:hypothetical protein